MDNTCSECGATDNLIPTEEGIDCVKCRERLLSMCADLLNQGKVGEAERFIKNSNHAEAWKQEKINYFIPDHLRYKKCERDKNNKQELRDLLKQEGWLNADRIVWSENDPERITQYEQIKSDLLRTHLQKRSEKQDESIRFNAEQIAALSKTAKAVLVQARAGSGKTTTIALRVHQLIQFYGATPEEILVLAFNKEASKEFGKRINAYHGKNVVDSTNCSTFHSLAYRILNPGQQLLFNDSEKGCEFVRGQQSEFIGRMYQQVLSQDRGMILTLLLNFFKALTKERTPRDFSNESDYYLYRRNLEYVSLGGERVKSKAEKFIADYLFEHRILYDGMECDYGYEQNLPGGKKRYKPDFSFWVSGNPKASLPVAILEHFGVTEDHPADRRYMSKDEEISYLKEMRWKREYCHEKKIRFISTSVDDLDHAQTDERSGFERVLLSRLQDAGFSLHPLSKDEAIEKLLSIEANLSRFYSQMTQFINRAKKQLLSPSDIQHLAEVNADTLGERSKNFLKITRRVYERYQKELQIENKLDFDDLLIGAAETIKQTNGECEIEILGTHRKVKDIQYILIDEYQDFSKPFYELIDAIRGTNPDISFFCVGDDWQAINGFAGSDLKFFKHFENYFPGSTRTFLLTNHRSGAHIVKHANLIMPNCRPGGKPDSSNDSLGSVFCGVLDRVEWKKNQNSNLTLMQI